MKAPIVRCSAGVTMLVLIAASQASELQADSPSVGGDAKLKALQEERRDTLAQRLEGLREQYMQGNASLRTVISASNALLDAELRLADQHSDRIALFAERVKNSRKLEDLLRQQHLIGSVPSEEVLAATAARLQAEIDLLNAKDSGALKRLPLTAGDISSVTGLNIYKFRVAMKPGTPFEVAISVQDARDAEPRFLNRQSFASDEDAQAVDLRLSFLPRDNKLRGVLLSQDDEVDYRIDCQACSPSGTATIISLPLHEIPGTRKTLIPMTAKRSHNLSDENETCLIAIIASQEGQSVSMQECFPRAKVSVRLTE